MGTLVGITVVDYLPVGIVHLRIRHGLNVIYGKNGVGKTRLLVAVQRLLNGDGPAKSWRGVPHSATRALYGAGGVHLVLRPGDEAVRADPAWDLLDSVVRHQLLTVEMLTAVEPPTDSVTAHEWTEFAIERIVAGATWPDPSEDEARELVEDGCWMMSPSEAGLEVFAASNPSRTLTERWLDAADDELPVSTDRLTSVLPTRGIEHSGWRAPDAMPPVPSRLGLEEPSWLAIPVAHVGTVLRDEVLPPLGELVTTIGESERPVVEPTRWALQWQVKRSSRAIGGESQAGTGPAAILTADGKASTALRAAAKRIEDQANRHLLSMFDGPPTLVLQVLPPEEWFNGEPIRWLAKLGRAPAISINELGSAHRRYALFAIQRALSSSRAATLSMALIDEPERALHRAAEGLLAEGLSLLADYVIVATHSPLLLDMNANLMRASLREDGRLRVTSDLTQGGSPSTELAERLGVNLSDLAARLKLVVLVEGPHDKAVIERFCPEEVGRADVHVVCLGGTHELAHLSAARLLFDVTDANFLVVTDNTDLAWVKKLSAGVRRRSTAKARHGFLGDQRRQARTSEEKLILEFFSSAVDADRLDRIRTPFGFKAHDIARYLPAERFLHGARDWDDVTREFKAANGVERLGQGDGKKLKEWISKQPGAPYNLTGIRLVAKETATGWADLEGGIEAHRPYEFADLAKAIRESVT